MNNFRTTSPLTETQWEDVIQDRSISYGLGLEALKVIYSFKGHQTSASQAGLILGLSGKNKASLLNLEFGRYGKRIAQKYKFPFFKNEKGEEQKWDIFFTGWFEKGKFIWKIRNELAEAIEKAHIVFEDKMAEEIACPSSTELEGAKREIVVNAYERNPQARSTCISHYGTKCYICGFDFEKVYGRLGKDFIHVHHLVPISSIGKEYEIDPIKDLRPVCPNCHAMLHRENPPLSIEELKKIIESRKQQLEDAYKGDE